MSRIVRALLVGACSLHFAGCEPQSAVTAGDVESLQFGTPLDAGRRQLYERSCHACHRNDVPGIPRAGDPADWAQRNAQGLDVLVQHAMNGFRGMPPMGLCADCTKEDMRAMIAYMAGIQLQANPE